MTHLLDEVGIEVDLAAPFGPNPQFTVGQVLASSIRHYVVATDPVGNFGQTFGTEVTVDAPCPSLLSLALAELTVAFSYTGVAVVAGAVFFYEQHRMGNFLETFGVEDYAVSGQGTTIHLNGYDLLAAIGNESVVIETNLSPLDVLWLPGGPAEIWGAPGVPDTAEVVQMIFMDDQGRPVETAYFRRDEAGDTSLTTFRSYDGQTVEMISQYNREVDFLFVSDLGEGRWSILRVADDGTGTVTTNADPEDAAAWTYSDPRQLWADPRLASVSQITVRFLDGDGGPVQVHDMVRSSDGSVVQTVDLDPGGNDGPERTIEYDAAGGVGLDTFVREDGTRTTRTYQPHVGVRGDTLGAIAQGYGLSLAELLEIPGNGVYRSDPDRLRAGSDVVAVPAEIRDYGADGSMVLDVIFTGAAPATFFSGWEDDFTRDTAVRFYGAGGEPVSVYSIARDPDGGAVDTTMTIRDLSGLPGPGEGEIVSVTRVRDTTEVTLETGVTAGDDWLDPWTAHYLEATGISRFSVTNTVWEETVAAFYPVSVEIENLFSRGEQSTLASPIVLDLDRNGYDTTTLVNGVRFDFDLNGFAEQMAWVQGTDGLLVLDRDGSGAIEHGGELFGDHTVLLDGSPAEHGFQALAELDGNADGLVDAADEFFQHLRVWRDLDHDGISDPGELFTLEAVGVEALGTDSVTVREADGRGNVIIEKGTFVRSDGSVGHMADFLFDRDVVRSVATEKLPVPAEIAVLPNVAGSGNVYDLHQALVRDGSGTLREILERFAAEPDPERRRAVVHEFLWTWSGKAGAAPDSRGPYVDARHLETLEAFLGTSFASPQNPDGRWADFITNPHMRAAPFVELAYERLAGGVYAVLSAQTHLKDLFGLVTEYRRDETGGRVLADLAPVVADLCRRLEEDPVSGKADLAEFSAVLRGLCGRGFAADYAGFRNSFALRGEELAWVVDSGGREVWIGGEGSDVRGSDFSLTNGSDDAFLGGGGDDLLRGGLGDDALYGGDGDDVLGGDEGADLLAGGPGADTLAGGPGDDVYVFGLGDGADLVRETSGGETDLDRVVFGPGTAPEDVVVYRDVGNLYLDLRGTEDRLTVEGWFWDRRYQVERFEFADGTVWGIDDVLSRIPQEATDGPDFLVGTEGGDDLSGLGGDDRLWGVAGDDRLAGGPGDDTLDGGRGTTSSKGKAAPTCWPATRETTSCGAATGAMSFAGRTVRTCWRGGGGRSPARG